MSTQPTINFAVIGINHFHIYGQVNLLLRAEAQAQRLGYLSDDN